MITRAEGNKEVVARIDWSDFDNDDPLSKIPVRVAQRAPRYFTGDKTGTRIEITKLRELPWTRRRVRTLHRAVTSISSPIDGPNEFEATVAIAPDPGDWLKGLLTAADIVGLSLFRFKGRIEDGELSYEYLFEPWAGMKGVDSRRTRKSNLAVEMSPDGAPKPKKTSKQDVDSDDPPTLEGKRIGPIEIDFHIFDRERNVLQFVPGNIDLVREFLDQNGGVRVYRNGVRVYDFGEAGNDWLDLGGRRVNVPAQRIGNNQIIGVVGLNLSKSQDLVEKTNREGFVENDAFLAFRAAIRFALAQAEAERNIDKQRIRKAFAKPRAKEPVLGEIADLREFVGKLDLDPGKDKQINQYLDRIEVQFKEILDNLLTAAGAGLNLAIVLHEVEKGIKSLYQSLLKVEKPEHVLDRAKQLADIIDSLTWLVRQSGISDVAADSLIKNCLLAWSYRFGNHKIIVTNGIEHGDASFTVRGNRRLLMTALMNLIDNAIYWVGTKGPANRRIYVGTTRDLNGEPALVVADSGPGLQDPPDYATMPFFTRKPDGIGLGLHISDEIMKMHGGRVGFPDREDLAIPKGHDGAVILLQFGGKKA